jgi:hypothetical protein
VAAQGLAGQDRAPAGVVEDPGQYSWLFFGKILRMGVCA